MAVSLSQENLDMEFRPKRGVKEKLRWEDSNPQKVTHRALKAPKRSRGPVTYNVRARHLVAPSLPGQWLQGTSFECNSVSTVPFSLSIRLDTGQHKPSFNLISVLAEARA